jgi:hypothetical protein
MNSFYSFEDSSTERYDRRTRRKRCAALGSFGWTNHGDHERGIDLCSASRALTRDADASALKGYTTGLRSLVWVPWDGSLPL